MNTNLTDKQLDEACDIALRMVDSAFEGHETIEIGVAMTASAVAVVSVYSACCDQANERFDADDLMDWLQVVVRDAAKRLIDEKVLN